MPYNIHYGRAHSMHRAYAQFVYAAHTCARENTSCVKATPTVTGWSVTSFSGAPSPFGALRGRARPRPTCRRTRRGATLKPSWAARTRGTCTSATSSLGLCSSSGSVREAPRQTSPKQTNGALQKWLSDSTGGEVASSRAAESRRRRRRGSAGLTSQPLRAARRVAMAAASRPPASVPGSREAAHERGLRPASRAAAETGAANSCPFLSSGRRSWRRRMEQRPRTQRKTSALFCLRLNFLPPPMGAF
jgi:hypothetical protein